MVRRCWWFSKLFTAGYAHATALAGFFGRSFAAAPRVFRWNFSFNLRKHELDLVNDNLRSFEGLDNDLQNKTARSFKTQLSGSAKSKFTELSHTVSA